MSISFATQPTTSISLRAWSSVRSLVAKPGMVMPMMLVRGSFSRSMALAHTSSACVESSPPETPITTLEMPLADSRWTSACTWML